VNQDKKLYESAHVWDQDLQLGQKAVIQAIVDFFPDEVSTILDVGCGDGKVTSAIIKSIGKPIVGLDFSDEALSRCNFETVRGDAANLPFGDQKFDLVMTTDTFEHLPDNVESLAWSQLFRVARNWVVATVPFRENLLDASIKCNCCGHVYHANWHMRSYDWRDLCKKAPEGWEVEAIVLTGEPWPAYHPLETEYRRKILDEWSDWVDAVCPNCGAAGGQPKTPIALSQEVAQMLGHAIAVEREYRPLERQFSEVMCFFKRKGCIESLKNIPLVRSTVTETSHMYIEPSTATNNLVPFPQYPSLVKGENETIIAQLPHLPKASSIFLEGHQEQIQTFPVVVEDGLGELLAQDVTLAQGEVLTIPLLREVDYGYYGLLIRLPGRVSQISVGLNPSHPGELCDPQSNACYHLSTINGVRVYRQVIRRVWVDDAALTRPHSVATTEGMNPWSISADLARMLFQEMGRLASSQSQLGLKENFAMHQLGTDVTTLNSTVTALNSDLTTLNNGLAQLYSDVATLKSEVLWLREKIEPPIPDIALTESKADAEEAVPRSEYDIVDGRPRVVMLCHDQHLDRRVIAQAKSLIAIGCKVTLFALSYTADDEVQITPEGIRLLRIGLRNIIPANKTYKAHIARQNRLNSILNICCNRVAIGGRIWRPSIRLAHRANWILYRFLLLLRYRSRRMSDPLPFTSAFLNAGMRVEADLIQVHDLPALEAGVQLAAEKQVPLVYDAHELYPEQRSFSKCQTRICAEAEARLIKHADLVFAVNESIGVEMAKRYGISQPITVLNALDAAAEFDPGFKYDILREKAGLSQDRKILLYQGGFSPNRNLETLIQAMALIKNPAVDLIMLGFGAFGSTLRRRALKLGLLNKRVFFLDAVPPSELVQHSASADIGIIPYPHVDLNSYYCTPNKLFEFMQAGLPILANDSPELRRFVAETGFGATRPMNNAKEMARAIDEAFSSPEYATWRQALLTNRDAYTWTAQSASYVEAMRPFLFNKP